jgi:RsiG-like
VEPFPDLSSLTDEALEELLRRLEREEDAVSGRRRLLHERIDLLRAARTERLRAQVEAGGVELPVPEALERPLYAGSGEPLGDGELPAMPDLATLGDDDLRTAVRALEHEEDDISLRRRFLQGQVDILRAERAKRARSHGAEHVGTGELGAILGGHPAPDGGR